jgi:hypothetical protein
VTLTFCFALLVFAPLLRAEPLDRRQLPAATTWFIHVDVEAASASMLGRGARGFLLSLPEARKAIEKAREALGIDITSDIRGITLYGVSYAPDRGVLIVRGKVDRSRLETMLQKMAGYRTETVDGRSLYFWTERDQPRRVNAEPSSRTQAGAFSGDDGVVVANDAQAVVAALDVLDGKAASLPADSPLVVSSPSGTVICSAAVGIAQAKTLPIQSPILRQCESGSLALGEHDGDAFFHARVLTQSTQTAAQIRASVEGLRAMVELQATENAVAARLLQPLKVTTDDKSVDVDWNFPSAELVKMVTTWIASHEAQAPPGGKQ